MPIKNVLVEETSIKSPTQNICAEHLCYSPLPIGSYAVDGWSSAIGSETRPDPLLAKHPVKYETDLGRASRVIFTKCESGNLKEDFYKYLKFLFEFV